MTSSAALAAVAALAALALPGPTAWGADAGGAQAPSAPTAGGSEYGVSTGPPVATRPVLSEFAVPSHAVAGGPPRIVLRVDEPGTPSVRARVVFLSLPHHRAALRLDLGDIVTGHAQALAWPRRTTLGPGSYLVQFHAYDARGATLLRQAHAAARAVMTIVSAPGVARPSPSLPGPTAPNPLHPPSFIPPPPGSSGSLAPAAPTHGGGVFPVAGTHNFGGADARFGAVRSGHVHQGQDVIAAEGTPVVAPFSGSIITASYQAGGAGYYVTEHGSDGRDYFFAHCQHGSTAVSTGETVTPGQRLCLVGHTGDATGPHLHFEIWVGGWHAPGGYPIDPLPDLQRWERGA
jgi:hypothetical protein